MKKFWIRTASATVYALLFIGTMLSGQLIGNETIGTIIFAAFLLFVACGCTNEFIKIERLAGASPNAAVAYAYAVGTFLIVLLPNISEVEIDDFIYLLPALFILPFVLQLWRHSANPFADAALTLVPMLYIAIPLALMPYLHTKCNVMLMVLIMVWSNDSFAYMGGSLLGKHKMWERHSPGKTWEGTIIGVLFTIAIALIFGPMFDTAIEWYDWLVLAIICSVIDTLGDLTESMLKRSVGLKDSGNIMPGHGGFLDRFDSLLVSVPCIWVYLCFR
ncbi:MAG: phosphatidate cytidylyltransferase [Bacteroidales bacterium]|nr:phosphatidate cytidylyltransferase [Bacteroidales bacterium]